MTAAVRTPGQARSHRAPVALGAALGATCVTLVAAAILEAAFYGHRGHDALSDIPGRFFAWHVHPSLLPYHFHPIEYPVVVGYASWVIAWFGRTGTGFFVATGLTSAGLALVMTAMLLPRAGNRIWRWALGLPLALYAFHNWDLLAMVPAIAGLLAFDRDRDRTSGALLALGGFTKVFPALFLPPLAFVRWRAGDRRGACNLVGAFAVVAVVLNAPVALWRWHAWLFPASFQGARPPTWGSVWSWLFLSPGISSVVGTHAREFADVLSAVAVVAAVVAISLIAVRRQLDAMAIGGAVVGAFLLCNKVYSPNYDLWLLPFFVVLPVARRVFVGFIASTLGIFVLVFGFLHGAWSHGVVMSLLPGLVALRALTIVGVILTALRRPEPSAGAASLGLRGLGHQLGLLDRERGLVIPGPALQASPRTDLGDEEGQRRRDCEHDGREDERHAGAGDDRVVDGVAQGRGVRRGQST